MTIKGIQLRFFLIYTLAVITVGITLDLVGADGGISVNIAVLAGSVVWACASFVRANCRYFSRQEKMMVVAGFLAIDLAIQVLLGAAALVQTPSGVDVGALLFAVGLVGILHGIAIYLFVTVAGRSVLKQDPVNT